MDYYDRKLALLDRKAFASSAVFAQEAETIFASSWLLVGLAGWVAEPGDFCTSLMGAEPVILWRMPSDRLVVLANRCPVGEKPLTNQARGRAEKFICPCHGYAYNEVVQPVIATAVVTVYRGLVFAMREAPARAFEEANGSFHFYLDALMGDEARASMDEPIRWRVRANWKIILEAWCAPADPPSDCLARGAVQVERVNGFQVATDEGVAAFATDADLPHENAGPLAGLAAVAGVLFPNLVFDPYASALHICHPVAPQVTEIHSYCLMGRAESPARTALRHSALMCRLGPGVDETSRRIMAWESISSGAGGLLAGRVKLNLQRGLDDERLMNLPGVSGALSSETNARAFYSWWQARLQSPPASPVPATGSHSFHLLRQNPSTLHVEVS